MIESSRESGRKLLSGIADYARHFGPWRIHWEPQGLRSIGQVVKEQDFDGILVRDIADLDGVVAGATPTVVFTYGKTLPSGVINVDTDDRRISASIAQSLVDRGFEHFAFFGPIGLNWSERRAACFREALDAAGFSGSEFLVDRCGSSSASQAKSICEWLEALPKPVGIMVANDEEGHFLLQLCHEAGVRVPEECAIIGVDNDPVVCGVCDPPLSSISLQQHQAGYRAATALDQMMRGEAPSERLITSEVGELVIRASSDVFAIHDVAVSKALRFIQANVQRQLSVDEIVAASGVFRRGLERRFRHSLGQTIQQRYREVRGQYLARLLVESHLSIEMIAEQCGFAEPSHLSRFFMSVRGESPSAFRKRSLAS